MTGLTLGAPLRRSDGRLDPAVLPRWRVAGPGGQAVDVVSLGLACCAVEALVGASVPGPAGPAAVTVLVVAGTVTRAQGAAVTELREALGARVISYGACADSGGPYWDSPVVDRGSWHSEADLFVAGCPPTPGQLVTAIAEVCRG